MHSIALLAWILPVFSIFGVGSSRLVRIGLPNRQTTPFSRALLGRFLVKTKEKVDVG